MHWNDDPDSLLTKEKEADVDEVPDVGAAVIVVCGGVVSADLFDRGAASAAGTEVAIITAAIATGASAAPNMRSGRRASRDLDKEDV